jgi:hypothetical protein
VVLRLPTRWLLTLGVVAALLVAGGIAAASLLGRSHTAEQTVDDAAPRDAVAAPDPAGWQPVVNQDARLSYDVPPDWEVAPDDESLTTSNGVKLEHLADWGRYTCQGAEYGRAFAGSGVAQSDQKPGKAASELAAAIAADQYSDGHQTAAVKVSKPQPTSVRGVQGAIVHAEATLTDAADGCAGAKGTVTVVALATPAGNSVFVIGGDVAPGPEEPAPAPLASPQLLTTIVDSLRVAP